MLDVAIFTALGWERRAVTAGFAGLAALSEQTWEGRLGDGSSCLVVQTGMGPERARAAASQVPPAHAFLMCGCAGALAPWLRPGDLVVASRVVALDEHGRTRDIPAVAEPIAAWGAAHGRRLHVGPMLSAPSLFTSASNGERGDAIAVEMEHAGVAAEALARGIPFVGLRVILDREDQSVPFVDTIDEATGELKTGRTIATLTVRPWLWPAAARLAWQARVADRELRKVMRELIRTGSTVLVGGMPSSAVAAS